MSYRLKHLPILCFLLAAACCSRAAERDSVFVGAGADGWNILHRVLPGETIFSLSRRYHVPPSMLAAANGKTYSDGLATGSALYVPMGAYNLLTRAPQNTDEARPLYFRVAAGDKLYRISRSAGVSQQALAAWNALPPGEPPPGKVLLVGWVRYDATPVTHVPPPSSMPSSPPSLPGGMVVREDTPKYVLQPPVDTAMPVAKPDIHTMLQQLWKEQTADGQNIVTENGTAGFFSLTGNTAGAAVYAFHNMAAKGTVIRVRNLNNGRIIHVKVLGTLPQTKQYAGCVIGLSNGAKAALGIHEKKAFCEMSYAGN